MQGWIKLHRQLLDWEWYDDINTSRLFIHLLLVANHEDKSWRGIEIKRGQRLTSLDKLAKETGLTVSQIRTCLKKLKSTNEVTSKSHTQHTVFTVENYDSYQGNDKQDDKSVANESQTNDKRIATNKNDKKEKNDKNTLDFSKWPSNPKEQIFKEWKQLRTKLKATVTQTVVNRFGKELTKAASMGYSVDLCLETCIYKGWRGFEADWMKNAARPDIQQQQMQTNNNNQQQSAMDEIMKDF